jgi:peptidyl-prolyl cis-trans isomerase D
MLMKWLRKHRYTIFLITIGGFLIGSFMGFGSYFFTQSPYDAVMVVNGEKIPYNRYQNRLNQYIRQRESGDPLNEEKMKALKQQVLQDMVRETVFVQEADKYGIAVTDNELAAYIQSAPAFQKDGRFDQSTYLHVIHQILRVPAEEFEKDRRRELKIQKLQSLMASAVKIGDLEFGWAYQKAMATLPPDGRKKIQENPAALREELRQEQAAQAFQEWLAQVNTRLKVRIFLDKWEKQQQGRG